MTRMRLGFPLLVAILLLLLFIFAPKWLWPGAAEPNSPDTILLEIIESPLVAVTQRQAASPLVSPLTTPISPPSGYIEADSSSDPRRLRISFIFDRSMDKESVAWALQVTPPR